MSSFLFILSGVLVCIGLYLVEATAHPIKGIIEAMGQNKREKLLLTERLKQEQLRTKILEEEHLNRQLNLDSKKQPAGL